jgi:DNA processing protein
LIAAGGPTTLTDAQRLDWLRLLRTDNVGPATFRQLLNRFGSAAAAIDALPSLVQRSGRPLRVPTRAAAEDVVGARNASAAGVKMTRMLAGDLGERGYTVVSGLARGIDTAAHRATLTSGTIAVLAGGLDKIYPAENIPLAHDILDNGGALLTEMPLGWEPRARDFPRRNRLVSGLSLGIVVVEAAKRSGSLITARLALEQNRDVFAVPGSPLDPRAEGGNALIQQGAKLITCAQDIIETLGSADPARNALFDRDWEPDLQPDMAPPSEDDKSRLLAALTATPIEVDELVRQSGLSVSAMQMLLLELDLAGEIEWSSGQLVALKY